MTPKEKAEQLIKYFDLPQYDKDKNIVFTFNHFTIEQKKYCILKHIDEKLNATFENSNDYYFYVQVRKEIENYNNNMKQLQIIRDVKTEIESELKNENFLQDIGDEYLIECKDFNVYITKDFWRVTLCIGGTPITELYPKTQFEIFTILATLKKYI